MYTPNEAAQMAEAGLTVDEYKPTSRNLLKIANALREYYYRNDQSVPSSLDELILEGHLEDPEALLDPVTGERFTYVKGFSILPDFLSDEKSVVITAARGDSTFYLWNRMVFEVVR